MLKILLNSIDYLLCLALTVFFCKPYIWQLAMLGIVAAAFAMTKRNDVCRDSTRTIRIVKWYPMISRKFMEKSLRSSADGTAIIEVFQRPSPIRCRKCRRKTFFTRKTSMCSRLRYLPMGRLPGLIVFPYLFAIIGLPYALITSDIFYVLISPCGESAPNAIFALGGKTVFLSFVSGEVFCTARKIAIACIAVLNRCGMIAHRHSVNLTVSQSPAVPTARGLSFEYPSILSHGGHYAQ